MATAIDHLSLGGGMIHQLTGGNRERDVDAGPALTIVRRIGTGMSSFVYEAELQQELFALSPGTAIGLKIYKPEVIYNLPHALDRIKREVQIGKAAKSENLLKIYGEISATLGGYPTVAICMELCGPETLSEFIARNPSIEDRDLLVICNGLATGLQALHQMRVIHRDLKPDNVLISKEKSVKLCDLGVMRQDTSELTAHGEFLGTHKYAAPEYLNSGRCTIRSDIYSLGLIFSELLHGTGESQHERGTPGETTILKYNLLTIIPQLLSKNPEERPSLERIKEILSSTKPIVLPRGNLFESLRHIIPKHRVVDGVWLSRGYSAHLLAANLTKDDAAEVLATKSMDLIYRTPSYKELSDRPVPDEKEYGRLDFPIRQLIIGSLISELTAFLGQLPYDEHAEIRAFSRKYRSFVGRYASEESDTELRQRIIKFSGLGQDSDSDESHL